MPNGGLLKDASRGARKAGAGSGEHKLSGAATSAASCCRVNERHYTCAAAGLHSRAGFLKRFWQDIGLSCCVAINRPMLL